MIIHPSEDVRLSSSYGKEEETPEDQLLQRLVWVRFQSYWWPALLFQSYTELQEFLVDEMDTMMKAQMAVAIMRQMQERKNDIKVARLLGKSTLEIVEVTTKNYHDFYLKLPEILPNAINRSRYGRDTNHFLDIHRALDQVEVIISEVSDKPFSLLPGMGSTTWLQKAREQLAKRDNLFDQGDCTFYPEFRDHTRGDTSINPVAKERSMDHLMPSTSSIPPVPSHIVDQQHHNYHHDGAASDQDYHLLSQYHALSKLAQHHDSAEDDQSVGSMLSMGVVAPQRTSTGRAVRVVSATTKSNPKKPSVGDRRKRESMPSIQEGQVETRERIGIHGDYSKKVSESREGGPNTGGRKNLEERPRKESEKVSRLRKIGRVKRPPIIPRKTTTEIRRPPMTIAKERNFIAVPTESQSGMTRRVQEYLLHQQMSLTSEPEKEEEESYVGSDDAYRGMSIVAPARSEVSSISAALTGGSIEEDEVEESVAQEPALEDRPWKQKPKSRGETKRTEGISAAPSMYTEGSSVGDTSIVDHQLIDNENRPSGGHIEDKVESVAREPALEDRPRKQKPKSRGETKRTEGISAAPSMYTEASSVGDTSIVDHKLIANKNRPMSGSIIEDKVKRVAEEHALEDRPRKQEPKQKKEKKTSAEEISAAPSIYTEASSVGDASIVDHKLIANKNRPMGGSIIGDKRERVAEEPALEDRPRKHESKQKTKKKKRAEVISAAPSMYTEASSQGDTPIVNHKSTAKEDRPSVGSIEDKVKSIAQELIALEARPRKQNLKEKQKRAEDISAALSKYYAEPSSESDASIVDHKSIANKSSRRRRTRDLDDSVATSSTSSSGAFDNYLRETEQTLELLIKKEKDRLKEEQQRRNRYPSGERHHHYPSGERTYGGNKRNYQRPGRGRKNPELVTRIHRPKRRSRSRSHRHRQKEEPSGFMSCFPAGNDDQYELSVARSYASSIGEARSYATTGAKSVEILPGLEGDDIVPGLSNKINRLMGNKEFLASQYRKKKKAPIEILPGLEGDDITPGLSQQVDKLVARKGFFTRHDVLKMIEELDQRDDESSFDEDESISINRFDELARQRVRNITMRR